MVSKLPLLRILTIFLVAFVLLQYQSFLSNVVFYASGQVLSAVHENQWQFVLLNILIFGIFLVPLYYRKKANWKNTGLFSAFLISLFVEMYGFPLSIYFASNALGLGGSAPSHSFVFSLDLFGLRLGFDYWMTFGAIVILLGLGLISVAWYQLWKSKSDFFTGGLYQYSRHPQYAGFLFVVWGWLLAWPTILTLLMAPVLTWAYWSAAKSEEKELLQKHLNQFVQYKKTTPLLI